MKVGYAPEQIQQRAIQTKPIVVQPDQPDIVVNVPKQDNTVLWVGMVIVPVVLAVLGWWFKAKLQIYGRQRHKR